MGKSGVQTVKLSPILSFQENSESKFSNISESKEVSIVEKVSGKLNVKIRFNRLRRRMRNRSTNIL